MATSLISRNGAGVFPPRKSGQTDGDLRKELKERKAPCDSTILTRTELDIIRDMIAGKNVVTVTLRETQRGRTAAAEEHKRRMQEYDDEHRLDCDKSLEEIEDEQQRRLNLERARHLIDEQFEEVKLMNQIVTEAKCIAVRNAQIKEKQRQKEEEREYERKMSEMALLEAKKAQKMYNERERQHMEGQKRNLEVVRAQLQDRELERIKILEGQQLEQEAMTRHIERLREEDAARKLQRQEAARRLMEDAALANAEQIKLKKRKQELELEEDRRILEYIKQKQERERLLAEEQQRLRDEKEREVARLQAQQRRVQDKQSQLDSIRAKRAQEAHEREQRRKDKERKEHERAVQEDLNRVREQQMEERRRLKEEQRRLEVEELENIFAVQKIAQEKEAERKAKARQQYEENSLAVLKQLMEVEERRRRERQEYVAEGNQIMMNLRERESAIEVIRQRKLKELEDLGVPKEYSQALLRKIKVRGVI